MLRIFLFKPTVVLRRQQCHTMAQRKRDRHDQRHRSVVRRQPHLLVNLVNHEGSIDHQDKSRRAQYDP